MIQYKLIEAEKNLEVKAKEEDDPQVPLEIANIVERVITREIVQLLAKDAQSVVRTIILRLTVSLQKNVTQTKIDPNRKERVGNFMK